MSLLASILLKVTITTALALVGVRLARKSRAAVRHVLLAAAFAVLAILPIASLVAPSVSVPVPLAVQEAIVSFDVADDIAARDTPPMTATAVGTPAGLRWSWPSLLSLLVAGWIAGAALLLLRVLAGLRQLRSLRRSGLPWRDGQSMADALAAEANLHRRIEVMLHEGVTGPMTCGVRHPAIVLPIDAHTWAREDLHRALVHELEHVRRRDWVSRCLARVVVACYWFHPMVWVAWRQLVLEAERACDDAVLASTALSPGHDPSIAYADQLVLLAQGLSEGARQPQLAMANRTDLLARVIAVLDSRQRRGRAGAACVGLALLGSALLVAAMSPIRIVAVTAAEDTQQVAANAPPARFEAATVKPCAPEDELTGSRGRGSAGGTGATISPGRFTVPCVTLEQLIYLAYASYGARDDERLANDYLGTASDDKKVRGGPAWVHSQKDKYAIEATAPGVTDRRILMGTMLRTLLEERFQLKIHRESEDVLMFALRVAKSGLKLKPMKDGDCDKDAAGTPPPWTKTPCGFMTRSSADRSRWQYVGFQLGFLARQLSTEVGRHVIDETGVAGEYIIQLEFAAEQSPGVSIFTALEEQLGLKLETTNGKRDFIVIDRAERPKPD